MFTAIALRALSIVYGTAMFGFMACIAVYRDGVFTRNRKMSDEEKRELELGT